MLLFRSFVSIILSYSIIITSVLPSYSQEAFRAENVSCAVSSDEDFQNSLEKIVRNVMGSSLEGINYSSIVEDSWRNYNVNQTIDRLVDDEVKRLRREKSILELVSTLASSDAREELAKELAEGVYGSDEFKKIVENVANDVGTVITQRLDKISSKAENPVSNCISKYIGPSTEIPLHSMSPSKHASVCQLILMMQNQKPVLLILFQLLPEVLQVDCL